MAPKFILMSLLPTYVYADDGSRIPMPLQNINGIIDKIVERTPKRKLFVWVCNEETAYEENDIRATTVFKSFGMSGESTTFEKYVILDGRNIGEAEDLIKNADLVLLCGGKVFCQKKFLDKINLKKLIKDSHALFIGISSGAMNLCENICNFPEEPADLVEPRFLNGIGVFDKCIIPHLNARIMVYEFAFEEIDIVGDYILPESYNRQLIGIDNKSYILVEDGNASYYGDVYSIKDGKATKMK